MKVLLTATSYPSTESDWKGLFIREQVAAIARRPDIELATWTPPGPLPANVSRATFADDESWLDQLMGRGGIAHLLRRRPVRGVLSGIELVHRHRRACKRSNVDLYHVNWLQNAIGLPRDSKPALVTALGSDMKLLRLPGMRQTLRHRLGARATAICPNAGWMVPPLRQAFGDIATVRLVPFGIDPRWYSMLRRFESNPTPVWLCVSRLTERKIGPLFDWTAPYFSQGQAQLHLIGPMQEPLSLPPWAHWHGPATPRALRDSWFPQATGLISLSKHDEGRPQVMLEALASGLPIIASRLPAHDDLLASGDGGVLVDSADATRTALAALSDPAANLALGLRGRARMQGQIGTWDDCAERYVDVYRGLCAQARA